ncbi:MAG: hypothetical protein ACYDCQ_17290, partial [Dehalococcoidia bacterium]
AGGLYDATHLHYFSLRELQHLIREAGFHIESLIAAPRTRRGDRIARLPTPIPRMFELVGAGSFKLAQLRPGFWASSFLAVVRPDFP